MNYQTEFAIDVLRSYIDFAPKTEGYDDIVDTIEFLEAVSEYGPYGEILEILENMKK